MSTISSRSNLELSLAMAGTLMTPEEFDAVSECDPAYAYELVRGVLIVTPIPSEAESDPNEELGFLLRIYQTQHVQGAALDLTLGERYVRVPDGRRRADRVIWAGLGRLPLPVQDVPTIVVEFVSRSRRDRVRDYEHKRGEYLELGVKEYWVIDRFDRVMTVFRAKSDVGGDEANVEVIGETGVYRTDLLPGFALPLSRLLAVADKWA